MSKLDKLRTLIPMEEIEQEAQKQIYDALDLDFLIRLAIMPDVHCGYSLPIGGIALLEKVISPAYIGYDINCFVGDTKIPLPDGNDYTLKELYDRKFKNFPVYSIDSEGNHKIGIADEVKLTRKNSDLVKVVLDNNEEIICTPDELFLSIDMSYIEASNLKPGQSLFPFRRYLDRDGYEYLGVRGTSKAEPTYWVVANSGLMGDIPEFENGTQIHHKDKNKQNNFPCNLEFIDKISHCRWHGIDRNYFATEDFKNKKQKIIHDRGYYFDPSLLKKKQEIGTINILNFQKNNPDKFKELSKRNGERGGKFFSKKNSDKIMVLKQKLGRIFKIVYKCMETYGEITERNYEEIRRLFYNYPYYKNAISIIREAGYDNFEELWLKSNIGNNHKVIKVEKLNYKEDVFCMTVGKYNNFALSSGVFVHNCGMCRVITNLLFTEVIKDLEEAMKIRDVIFNKIPCGVGRTSNSNFDSFKSATGDKSFTKEVNDKLNQIGTLGSGNHFIEIGKNLKDNLCIIIHTGSRKPGWLIGHYYMNLSKKVDMDLPRDFLHLNGEAGQQYLQDMKYAENFAHNNRREIMSNILDILGLSKSLDMINITHNHAVVMGDNVLHRKGATPAEKDQIGIIPGSMQTGTYVTIGLGNEEYLSSSSHGAGRKLSRKKAKESINIDIVRTQMKGIVCAIDEYMLEEAPDAYKDLSAVVKLQEGIVINTIDYIKPIINIKG